MAKMGRPKIDNPADKRVTVRFRDEEYHMLLEYAEHHNMSIAQVIRWAVEMKVFTDPE